MKPNTVICPDSGRIIPKAYARVAGSRFKSPIDGYKAATMPDAPVRATRAEAMEDERLWLLRQK